MKYDLDSRDSASAMLTERSDEQGILCSADMECKHVLQSLDEREGESFYHLNRSADLTDAVSNKLAKRRALKSITGS